jgi:hypothetical protein
MPINRVPFQAYGESAIEASDGGVKPFAHAETSGLGNRSIQSTEVHWDPRPSTGCRPDWRTNGAPSRRSLGEIGLRSGDGWAAKTPAVDDPVDVALDVFAGVGAVDARH